MQNTETVQITKHRWFPLEVSDIIVLTTIALTLFIYIQVKDFDFINYDDPKYVAQNIHVMKGLSVENIKWAFTTIVDNNWLPLTLITHMIDVQLYGLKPGGHHFTNLILHLFNAVLLFILFSKLLASQWRAAFVSVMFAVTPMHVESVAWVAERKDVLCGFFWILTMLSYSHYAQSRKRAFLVLTTALYAFALMSKPMAVTLPFALLLLDYWPLRRFQSERGFKQLLPLVTEKIPMFVLSAIFSVVTFYAQNTGEVMAKLEYLPIDDRLKNAFIAYLSYFVKLVYPTNMAAIYTIERPAPIVKTLIAISFFVTMTALVIIYAKKAPAFFTGWFWFAGTLVPVIGLVQVGSQSMADRYTYIPSVGLFLAAAMAVPVFSDKVRKIIVAAVFAGITIFLTFTAHKQVSFWKTDIKLFEHAIEVTHNNYIALSNLGAAYMTRKMYDEAEIVLSKSILIERNYPPAYVNLANVYVRMGKFDEAIFNYTIADNLRPNSPYVYNGLGVILMSKGDIKGAEIYFKKALSIDPYYISAMNNLRRISGGKQ
ncbi:MAG: tetratricopeptide repeat protein [Nitrospirae bacterium]|nr:tetratricopeptide repeat protein [Nitrospirota bacterium]MBF0533517.1 tetratricopeptide repeat protein [Nitrospirota bacterium]MBF0615959.1 tetratricopeptide repeat protein [Nitrospirota bacterium]